MPTIKINDKEYVDLETAFAQTGYNRLYLARLAKAEKIDAVKIGASWVFHVPSIEHYRQARSGRGSMQYRIDTRAEFRAALREAVAGETRAREEFKAELETED